MIKMDDDEFEPEDNFDDESLDELDTLFDDD